MMCRPALLAYVLIAAVAMQVPPPRQDIFVPSSRYPCFRQPIILTAGGERAHVLAFAENRNVSACAPTARTGPEEVGSLLLRRSTDSGKTWLPLQSLYFRKGLNIDFLAGVTDIIRGKIWLMLQEGNTVQVFTSEDAGESWNGPRDLFETWHIKSWTPDILPSSLKPGCAHGVQLIGDMCAGGPCREAGRLLLPFVCANHSASGGHSDKGCGTCLACNLFSDDGGDTWELGGIGQVGTRESVITQVWSKTDHAELYINERNMGTHPGHRQSVRSLDGGRTYDPATFTVVQALTSPVTPHWTGIVAGVSRLVAPGKDGHGGVVVYTGPAATDARADMSVHMSKDEGVTWGEGKVLWKGPAGYSDLAWVGNTSVAVVFENGDVSFADRVSVAVIPSSWGE